MKKIILLTLLLPCLFLNGYSVSLDSYLSYVEQRFDESQLVVEDFKTSTISNALALAIASTDMEKSQKFLQVIDDVNDDKLASSAGYRKLVGLPHIAVNPIVQMKIFDNKAKLDFAYAKKDA
ncbi:hypothetical protein [Francisella hispaniensis]|uniref:hypothetical protein n=1 Tax=Francisella hispaniensis TaxID=622488 RepID=UPI001906E2D1|nr:hypothetical protein [Francisella hispaniensis]MBK2357781.1 hypothetical protein [Francisella hispaniensis]